MSKKILLAESSQVTRSVAEKLLRQNGFEVISVTTGEKAVEVIEFTRPDLIIIGGELTSSGKKPLYDKMQESPRTASIPLLILCDENASYPFPDEILIRRPFEPKEFIDTVMIFAGNADKVEASSNENPLGSAELKDEILDHALGLDKIEVEEAEVMNRENTSSKISVTSKQEKEKLLGFDTNHDSDPDHSDTGMIPSVVISGEHTDIVVSDKSQKPKISSDDELVLDDDQFGISTSEGHGLDDAPVDDYDQFLKDMKDENQEREEDGTKAVKSQPVKQSAPDDDELSFLHISDGVDQVKSPANVKSSQPAPTKKTSGGVDKFIEEFKKEVEQIDDTGAEEIKLTESQKLKQTKAGLNWEEKIENLTDEQVSLFTQKFIDELSGKIAKLIVSKIDSGKLLAMLKNEIIAESKKNSEL